MIYENQVNPILEELRKEYSSLNEELFNLIFEKVYSEWDGVSLFGIKVNFKKEVNFVQECIFAFNAGKF